MTQKKKTRMHYPQRYGKDAFSRFVRLYDVDMGLVLDELETIRKCLSHLMPIEPE